MGRKKKFLRINFDSNSRVYGIYFPCSRPDLGWLPAAVSSTLSEACSKIKKPFDGTLKGSFFLRGGDVFTASLSLASSSNIIETTARRILRQFLSNGRVPSKYRSVCSFETCPCFCHPLWCGTTGDDVERISFALFFFVFKDNALCKTDQVTVAACTCALPVVLTFSLRAFS